MELGFYTVELKRPTLEELFQAGREYGFTQAQLDFRSVGEEELPRSLSSALAARIRRAAEEGGVRLAAVNGTWNMIHPDPEVRKEGLRRFREVAAACGEMGCSFLTLCTGSRNREHMWSWHEGNREPDAWEDLLRSVEEALEAADRNGLSLGVECEASNVVYSPERARRLLEHFGSPRLQIIMDPANLFLPGEAKRERVRPTLDRAFRLVGGSVGLAHGKDVREGEDLAFTHAGDGIVDFPYLLENLSRCGYRGPMILHGIKSELFFPAAIAHAKGCMAD